MERETQKQKAKREAEERVERATAHDVFISKLQVRADTSVDCVGDGSFECLKYPIKAPREKAKQCIPGDIALVHYTGWLVEPAPEGDPVLTKEMIATATARAPFDSSRGRGREFTFRVGMNHVIPGWDTGVAAMQKGERSYLLLSPKYGYGASGAGDVIPPNAWMLFDVELVEIQETVMEATVLTTPSYMAAIITTICVSYYYFFVVRAGGAAVAAVAADADSEL